MLSEFKHSDLTREILAAAFEVHRTLGPGFVEKVYHHALVHELRERGRGVRSELRIPVMYKGTQVGEHVLDILVDDRVIVELKAVSELVDVHTATVLSYLAATRLSVALLLKFRKSSLQVKRLVR